MRGGKAHVSGESSVGPYAFDVGRSDLSILSGGILVGSRLASRSTPVRTLRIWIRRAAGRLNEREADDGCKRDDDESDRYCSKKNTKLPALLLVTLHPEACSSACRIVLE
jgi:hypothetical protein